MELETLTNDDLLAQYAAMVRWQHYDPMGNRRPSRFELDELEAELRRRLSGNDPAPEQD